VSLSKNYESHIQYKLHPKILFRFAHFAHKTPSGHAINDKPLMTSMAQTDILDGAHNIANFINHLSTSISHEIQSIRF